MPARRPTLAILSLVGLFLMPLPADEPKKDDPKNKKLVPKMAAGKSEVLRHIPKKFATLQKVDTSKHEITILEEGGKEPKTWTVNADAELKIHGWWGRLDQFHLGDRVWVWFDIDRQGKAKSILMLADEISQQDIHGTPYVTDSLEPGKSISLKLDKNPVRTLAYTASEAPKPGAKVYVQSAGPAVREIVDAAGFEKLRDEQKALLRKRWTDDGLAGTVVFLHRLSGEMELMIDHEGMRWARNLQRNDKVTIKTDDLIPCDVKLVQPWRERTQIRLVVDGSDQALLSPGQRVQLLVHAPPPEVDTAAYPPDIDRPRSKGERTEWFLCSTYCACGVGHNVCTGMFYTLASCNENACGMPNHIRDVVAEMIDKGMTDKQIWDDLKKSQGPLMLRPHLLP